VQERQATRAWKIFTSDKNERISFDAAGGGAMIMPVMWPRIVRFESDWTLDGHVLDWHLL
jgi:hypothetical protein